MKGGNQESDMDRLWLRNTTLVEVCEISHKRVRPEIRSARR